MRKRTNAAPYDRRHVGLVVVAWLVSVPAVAQELGPILHLPMNDGPGSDSAADVSENGLNGTLTNMDPATDWVAGIDLDGLDFDGTDDFVDVADDDVLDFGAGDFSVSLWVFKRGTSENVCDNVFGVSKWSTGASPGTNEWALQVGTCPSSGPRTNEPGMSIEVGSTIHRVRSPDPLTLHEWHHVVGVRDGRLLRLYVDGVLKATDASQSCNASVNDVGHTLRIARNQATGFLPATNAVFDEIQIYPFALDDGGVSIGEAASGEIAALFADPSAVVTRTPPTTTTTLIACPADCGDATRDGAITASDALAALASAVGQQACDLCICDVNRTESLTATDALAILSYSVGSLCQLSCPGTRND